MKYATNENFYAEMWLSNVEKKKFEACFTEGTHNELLYRVGLL